MHRPAGLSGRRIEMNSGRNVRFFSAILALALAVSANTAGASDGFYLGAGAGQATIEIDDNEVDFDQDDFGWKAFAGYRFGSYFGVEGGYVSLGEPDDTVLGVDIEVDADGWDLFAVGFWPIGTRWDLFGKVGFIAWSADVKGSFEGISVSDDQDGEDLAFGLGVGWNMNDHFSFRGEWEYFDIDDTDEVYMLSVGAVYRF
jgi:OOP family OmpA-OmpF porin